MSGHVSGKLRLSHRKCKKKKIKRVSIAIVRVKKIGSLTQTVYFCADFILTAVVFDQFVERIKGCGGGDVKSTFIQTTDFVVFYHVSFFLIQISDGQWVGP